MYIIKLSFLKNRLSGILSVGTRIFRLSRVYCRPGTRIFRLSRVYCRLDTRYPRKFSCLCMYETTIIFITISVYLILVDIKLINAFKMSKIQNFCLLNQNCMNNPISKYCCGYICCNMIEYIIKDGYIYIF